MSSDKRFRYHAFTETMATTFIQTPSGFADLSKAEQIRYLLSLWDQISERPDEIPVPESHLKLAEERLQRYRENPSTGRSAFEVIDRLSEKPK